MITSCTEAHIILAQIAHGEYKKPRKGKAIEKVWDISAGQALDIYIKPKTIYQYREYSYLYLC